ncbi:WXG100 family type VII secretion target [Lentzea sp. NBRC 102530]|uniref:WXG100 family type VII secretion target n=1 Tax=Lentzea sp. NBRC 102530 TaxID=3032201 RepID=UPI00249F9BE8|nr:WXG100 family type VII secretion target [Lentzea sp. NBRC 102530]GLY54512.1 hypothetical protein Lesp01_81670 [Lentzea sp. NBRC 102530]
MSGTVSTTTPGMHKAAEHFLSTKAFSEQSASSVHRALVDLSGTWTGNAASAFQNAVARWMADCRTINGLLGQMAADMQMNSKEIQASEDENARIATSLPVGANAGLDGF